VFTFPPEYVLIDAPYQIQNPKRLYAPLKVKAKKEKSPKKDAKGAKGKKKEADTEEYLALLEVLLFFLFSLVREGIKTNSHLIF
jgi:hypothetical protein